MRTTWQLARDAGTLWLGQLRGLVMWACLGYVGNPPSPIHVATLASQQPSVVE